jgi:hypothetical protein
VIRTTLLACSIALLAAISSPNPACAGERVAAESEQPEKAEPLEGRELWRSRLLAANREVASAQKRNTAALRAYETMRHRRHPRGEGKQEIVDELERSREELASAQLELEKVEKAARRAGAQPSWLRFDPAELDAPAQVPAAPEP